MEKFKDTHFALHKSTNPQSKQFGVQKNLHGTVRSSGHFDYNGLPHILPTDVNGEHFAKGTEKFKILAGLMDKVVENLDDQGCPKVQDLVDEEIWVC